MNDHPMIFRGFGLISSVVFKVQKSGYIVYSCPNLIFISTIMYVEEELVLILNRMSWLPGEILNSSPSQKRE